MPVHPPDIEFLTNEPLYSPSLSEDAAAHAAQALAHRPKPRGSRRDAEFHAKTRSWFRRRPDREQQLWASDSCAKDYLGSNDSSSSVSPVRNTPRTARTRLAAMKRPSRAVPHPNDYSALAGMPKRDREKHKRRVLASMVLFEWLEKDGSVRAMPPPWLRDRGLDDYTPKLKPPPADADLKPPTRARRSALSCYYRGKKLRRVHVGNPRPGLTAHSLALRKKRDEEAGPEISSGQSDCGDLDAWCPSDEFSAAAAARVASRAVGDVQVPDTTAAQSDVPQEQPTIRTVQQVDKEREEREKKKAEESDPLAALMQSVMENDDFTLLIKEPVKPDPGAGEKSGASDDRGADNRNATKTEDVVDLVSPTQSPERRGALSRKRKRRRGRASTSRQRGRYSHERGREPDANHYTSDENGYDDADEVGGRNGNGSQTLDKERNPKGWMLMEKMGFKNAKHGLGRLENGICEPLRASSMSRTARGLQLGIGVEKSATRKAGTCNPATEKATTHNRDAAQVDPSRRDAGGVGSYGRGGISAGGRASADSADTARNSTVVPRDRGADADPEGAVAEPDSEVAVAPSPKTPKAPNTAALDPDDDMETENEGASQAVVDNGRRAVMVDFDLLVQNSRERRVRAFNLLVRSQQFRAARGLGARPVDVRRALFGSAREMIDADTIARMLGKGSKEVVEVMMKILDDAFRKGPKVVPNVELVEGLRRGTVAWKVEFAFLHRGSRQRFKEEASAMGLGRPFQRFMLLNWTGDDIWPYLRIWEEGRTKCGVSARHMVLLLNDGGEGLVGGVAAGAYIGARTIVAARVGEAAQKDTICVQEVKAKQHAVVGYEALSREVYSLMAAVLEQPVRLERRRRVLAMFTDDMQWYAARVVFDAGVARGEEQAHSLVEFFRWGNIEWVERDSMLRLPRREYCLMRRAEFRGLLDPADAKHADELAP